MRKLIDPNISPPDAALSEKDSLRRGTIESRHLVGIFFISVATLLLELSLTRVMSVALWYHFGFLVVSTALLGFGAAGVSIFLWPWAREKGELDRVLASFSLLFGLSTIGSFWLVQHVPFDPLDLFFDPRQWIVLPLYSLVQAAPFFCTGLVLSVAFSRAGQKVGTLYAVDLTGAGLGCFLIAAVMSAFGGSGSVVIAAALGMAACLAFGYRKERKLIVAAGVGCLICVVSAFSASRWLPIRVTATKLTPPFAPIFTAWNSFSRIDIYERKGNSAENMPTRRRILYDAGTAATGMRDLRPNVAEYLNKHQDDRDYGSGIAYLGKPAAKILILGSGAGVEILDGLHYRARDITAVEVNPIITNFETGPFSDFWGGMFKLPQVHLVNAEGRNFIRRSKERYDAIISVHTISNAAVAAGALSLSENYVLTREAFDDYVRHLSPDGIIYFTRPEPQIARLVTTAREVLEVTGTGDVAKHIFIYRIPPNDPERKFFGADRPSFLAGILVKRSPFTREEIDRVGAILGIGQSKAPGNDPSPPEVLYSPFAANAGSLFARLLTEPDLHNIYASQELQLKPVTDNQPFFNHSVKWSDIGFHSLREIASEKRLGMLLLVDRPIAEITLIALFAQSVLIAGILILAPLSMRKPRAYLPWKYLIYFAGIGLGFIACEMAFLSQFGLFLGEPVYSYAVTLGSLLVFAGMGSALSSRLRFTPIRALSWSMPCILLALLLMTFGVPWVFNFALGFSLPVRIVISILALLPLGVLLGIPFPSGLRILTTEVPALVPWAWGVNAFFTVIGTVTALMIAMTFGFRVVLAVAGTAYVLAWLSICPGSSHRSASQVSQEPLE